MHGFTWQLEERFVHAAEVRQQCDLQVVGLTTTELPSSQSSPTRLSCRRIPVTAVTVQGQSPTHHVTAAAATSSSMTSISFSFILLFKCVFCCTLQKLTDLCMV